MVCKTDQVDFLVSVGFVYYLTICFLAGCVVGLEAGSVAVESLVTAFCFESGAFFTNTFYTEGAEVGVGTCSASVSTVVTAAQKFPRAFSFSVSSMAGVALVSFTSVPLNLSTYYSVAASQAAVCKAAMSSGSFCAASSTYCSQTACQSSSGPLTLLDCCTSVLSFLWALTILCLCLRCKCQ